MATATSFAVKSTNDTTDPADPAKYGLLNPPVRITGSLTIPSADGTLLGEPVTAMAEGVVRREYLSGSAITSSGISGGTTLTDDIRQPQRLFQLIGARLKDVVADGMRTMFNSTIPRLADPTKAFNGGDLNIPWQTQGVGGTVRIVGNTRAFRDTFFLDNHPTPDPAYDNDTISYAECGHFDDWFPTNAEKAQMDALRAATGPFASGSPFDLYRVDELAGLVSKYSVPVSPNEGLHQVYDGYPEDTTSAFNIRCWTSSQLTNEARYLNEDKDYPALRPGWIRERWGRKFPGHENFKARLSESDFRAQFEILSGSTATEHAFDVFNSENPELMFLNRIMVVAFRHIKDRVKWFDSGTDGIPTFSLAQPCWAVARLAWRLERRRYDQIWYEEVQNNTPSLKTLYDVNTPVEMDTSGTLSSQSWDQTIGEGTLSGTGGYQHIDGGNWYWSTLANENSTIKKYSYEYGGTEFYGYSKTRDWLEGVQTGDPDNGSEFRLYRKIQTGEGPDDVEWNDILTYDEASGCAWVKLPGVAGATGTMYFGGNGSSNYSVLAPISAAALKLCQDKFPSTTPDNGYDYLNVWIDGLMLIYDKVRPFYS